MSNHYHIAVRTSDVKLWRSMARINGAVTRSYNRRLGLLGTGWQSRYRARLIQDENDLRHLLAYVHLNPVRAGIVEDPADYTLSGHQALIGRAPPILLDAREALHCFDADNLQVARSAYLNYLRQVSQAEWASDPVRVLPWWKPVSYDHQTVGESRAPSGARTFDDCFANLPTVMEPVDKLLSRTCGLLGFSLEEMTGAAKRRNVALARRRFTFIAAHRFGHRIKDIAEVLRKSSSQASRWLRWQTEAYHADCQEACHLDGIAVALLQKVSNNDTG